MKKMRPFKSSAFAELELRLRTDLGPVEWREGRPGVIERGVWVLLDLPEMMRRCMRYAGAPRADGYPYRLSHTRARRAARCTLSILRSHAIAAGVLPF